MRLLILVAALVVVGCGCEFSKASQREDGGYGPEAGTPAAPRSLISLSCVSSSSIATEVEVSVALSGSPADKRSITMVPGSRLSLGEFSQAGGERVEVQVTIPSTGASAAFGMDMPSKPMECVVRIVDADGMPFPSVGCTVQPPL